MTLNFLHNSNSKLAIIFIGIFSIIFLYIIRWNGYSGDNYQNIIKSDGIGYYNYIPSIINGDIGKQIENSSFLQKTTNDSVVNKYFIGTALVISPFVMPVYLFHSRENKTLDLYSEYYQKAISLAALFYALIGLLAFIKLLTLYKIDPKVKIFSLFALFFGTNLGYYTLIEPSMSHVYSFSFISIFLYKIKETNFSSKLNIIVLAALLAIIVLIRPINILILFAIPFLTSNILIKLKKYNLKSYITFFIVFSSIISIQSFIWSAQTGNLFIWPYANEGFYFSNPKVFDFLFSFRKGLFIYTPIALLSIAIFIIIHFKNTKTLLLAGVFIAIIIYALSSWWNWYYGDSFGSRVMIEFLVFFLLLFAISLNKMKLRWRQLTMIIASILILTNIFQSYQYYYQIISPYDMNYEKYRYTFCKYGNENKLILGGNNDIIQYHKSKPITILKDSVKNTDNLSSKQSFEYIIDANKLINYKSSFLIFSCKINKLENDLSKVYWRISHKTNTTDEILLTQFKINEIPLLPNQSRINNYTYRLPKPHTITGDYKLSIVNISNNEFLISEFKIELLGITN